MSADPILALTAGAELRAIAVPELENLKAIRARQGADAPPVLEAMIATREAEIAESLRLDALIYERFPHLRPEHTPDE